MVPSDLPDVVHSFQFPRRLLLPRITWRRHCPISMDCDRDGQAKARILNYILGIPCAVTADHPDIDLPETDSSTLLTCFYDAHGVDVPVHIESIPATYVEVQLLTIHGRKEPLDLPYT